MTVPASDEAQTWQPDNRRQPGPVFYVGPAVVAGWIGVSRTNLSNWLRRYTEFPPVAAVVAGPKRENWCWRPDQREEWIEWAEAMGVYDPGAAHDHACE